MEELLNKDIEMEDGSKYVVVDVATIEKKHYALISNVSDWSIWYKRDDG